MHAIKLMHRWATIKNFNVRNLVISSYNRCFFFQYLTWLLLRVDFIIDIFTVFYFYIFQLVESPYQQRLLHTEVWRDEISAYSDLPALGGAISTTLRVFSKGSHISLVFTGKLTLVHADHICGSTPSFLNGCTREINLFTIFFRQLSSKGMGLTYMLLTKSKGGQFLFSQERFVTRTNPNHFTVYTT